MMSKELNGSRLERILIDDFAKFVEFLRNPDNRDWVASIREKMNLDGFDEVYKPLEDASLEDNMTITTTAE